MKDFRFSIFDFRMVLILALLLGPGLLMAQGEREREQRVPGEIERVTMRMGVYGAYAMHEHRTTATVFEGSAECGAFGEGEGTGFAAGLLLELPVFREIVELYGSVGYTDRSGDLGEAYAANLPILDPNSGEYTQLERRHDYAATLGYLRTEFGVRLNAPWFPLYVRGTALLDVPQTSTFEQTERILSPQGVLYPETNRVVRTVAEGEMQNPESLIGAAAAIGYELFLSDRLSIAPEVSYYHPFSDVLLDRDWQIVSLQGGAALRFRFGETWQPEPPDAPIAALTPPPAPPREPLPPTASVGLASDVELGIVRTVVTETFPILPYIFFDSGSSRIPSRYRTLSASDRNSFDENTISWESLQAYYDMLNILGRRMVDDESITIRAAGTTDGSEGSGPTATKLATARAESVREYLVDTWGIDPDRITVAASARPRFPSSEEYREGYEENRRVEITSASRGALEPIVHRRFNEYSYRPNSIPLSLAGVSDDGIASWQLSIDAGDRQVTSTAGEGPPPATFRMDLDQSRAAAISEGLAASGGDLEARLLVRSNERLEGSSGIEIPTEVEVHPFEISRLSLIVFDFDKAEITRGNREMIERFVAEALTDESTLSIVGSTDRLGELEHNEELSAARAESVRAIVASEEPGATITTVAGVGPRLRYDNGLPEGRYYCRTVTVEVSTPLNEE